MVHVHVCLRLPWREGSSKSSPKAGHGSSSQAVGLSAELTEISHTQEREARTSLCCSGCPSPPFTITHRIDSL